MKKGDRILAIFWIFLGLTISIWSATFPFGGLKDPGPAYFPLGCGLIFILLGIILLFKTRVQKETILGSSENPVTHRAAIRRVSIVLVAMISFVTLLKLLGFVLTVFLLMLFLVQAIEPQKWRVTLIYAFISAIGSFTVFNILLKVPLPRNILGF